MYYYIVNPSSGDRSFESIQEKLKSKLRQLDIDGEFSKTLDAEDAAKLTQAALAKGAQTIVAVGGDKTVNEIITAVNESGKSSTSVGIVPIGHRNTLAKQLGATDWQQACELLAARRLRSFRLMHANDYSFIHSCSLISSSEKPNEALMEIDGEYRLRTPIKQCFISNLRLHNPNFPDRLLLNFYHRDEKPTRWQRWLQISPPEPVSSQIHARVAAIEFSQPVTASIDGREIRDSHFRIRLSEKPIHLITAKYNENRF